MVLFHAEFKTLHTVDYNTTVSIYQNIMIFSLKCIIDILINHDHSQ